MLAEYIHPITQWLHNNPDWGGAIAFTVAFAESLAVIGTIVPGSVTLTALGILIGSGVMPLGSTLFWAICGAISGDVLSFWCGRYFQESLKSVWPFNKNPHWLAKGEQFFQRHGGKSIFIGRFIGPIRSLLPITAGMLRMPWVRFVVVDIISAILWAPTYMLPGILIGAASAELSPHAATRLILIILLLLIALWLITWLVRAIIRFGLDRINQTLDNVWTYLRAHKSSHFITRLLQDPSHPEGHGQLTLAFLFLLSLGLFITLALTVKTSECFTPVNSVIFYLLQSIRTAELDKLMLAISFIGDKIVFVITGAAVLLAFSLQRDWRASAHWLLNGVIGIGVVLITKYWVLAERPAGLAVTRATSSFPSGHTTRCVLIFGFLALLIHYHLDKEKPYHWLGRAAAIIIGLVALSRLYLGTHWLTDVIGAVLLGLSCSLFFTLSYRRQFTLPIRIAPLLLISVLSFGTAYTYISWHSFGNQLIANTPYWPQWNITLAMWQQQKKPLLPLYRLSRTGRPQAPMNLQWVGTLTDIEGQLQKSGWQTMATPTTITRLERLIDRNKAQQLPFFDALFQLQSPVLVMTKPIDAQQPLLILRLWPSRLNFYDDARTLWLGSLHYRIIWPHHWLKKHRSSLSNLADPLSLLTADLPRQQWKTRQYPATVKLDKYLNNKEFVKVLLIENP